MKLIHLIGFDDDTWIKTNCGLEEHWRTEDGLKIVGNYKLVTCGACKRTNGYKALASGSTPITPVTYLRNMGERDHMKFGYDAMIEKRDIRAELEADGWRGFKLHFEVERRYEENHKNDPTYREISAAFSARCARTHVETTFTAEELIDIAEHYYGTNTPLGQSIQRKIRDRVNA